MGNTRVEKENEGTKRRKIVPTSSFLFWGSGRAYISVSVATFLHTRSKVHLQHSSTLTNTLRVPNKTINDVNMRQRDRQILVIGDHIMFVRSVVVNLNT